MGLFGSPQQKWIKKHIGTPWNMMFTGFGEDDVMITKLMVYACVSFADNLLSSGLFAGENLAIRSESILLAKMQFYHLVTKSATVHNTFYGYVHELWTNHYHEDLETANLALDRMHSQEKLYLSLYYDFYNRKEGSLAPVLKAFCNSAKRNQISGGEPILTCSAEELQECAAKLLMDMHIEFMAEMR